MCKQATRSSQGQDCSSNQLLSIENSPAPPRVYKVFVNFSLETQRKHLGVMLPPPQQMEETFGHPVSSEQCATINERVFGSRSWTPYPK